MDEGIFSPPRLLRRQSSRHQLRNFSFDLTERNSNDSYEFERGGANGPLRGDMGGTPGILLLVKSPEIAKKPKNSIELVDSRNRDTYFFISNEFKDDPIFEWGLKGVLRLKEPESPYKPNNPTPSSVGDDDPIDKFYIFDEEDPILRALYALENTYEVRELIFLYMWEEQRKTELVRAARQMETNIRELTNSSFTPGVYGYRAYMEIAEAYHMVENRLAFKKYCDSCDSSVIQFACPSTGNVFCSKKCAQRYFI
jgi:hypothetical protein